MTLKPLVIREIKNFLRNPAFIASIIILVVFYASLGSIMRSGIESAVKESLSISIGIVKEEDTELVSRLISMLSQYTNGSIGIYQSLEEAVDKTGVAIVIPRGFTENATQSGSTILLKGGVKIDNLSPITGQARISMLQGIASIISDMLPAATGVLYNISIPPSRPVMVESYVRVYDKTLTANEFNSFMTMFSIIPVVIGIIVGINATYAAQATAIEKVEKAFEMLLAQPIPRRSVVIAKIIGSVTASVIMGAAYMIALFLMLVSAIPAGTALGNRSSINLVESVISIGGTGNILVSILVIILGLIYSGAIGVIIGAVVADERIAGALSTPIILLFMGVGFATIYMGMPLNMATSILSGLTITSIPLVLINASLSGQYIYAWISISIAITVSILLMVIAILVFNRDIVILGLRISLRKRE
ncbi:ABC-type Na+ efflux pump, permease [Desulfurococcus amylolyticus 1221n]|uniref:ABC-type Na+ efflux pump, permease n=1 Tax=Desulfurococcus amylolyticus (strain DSM 18924 / JCM 16383 / VKM B-2413 / 1221n) TaxID=490899 RepID=B8D3I5_DESA1|nr:ABC transporter permease [Desulfurococcus amylolyticus]ACL10666.1 ABC-type Na+ efflux pump, permease [Desulfurococcus amylolyticus 1221n]